MSSYPPDSLVSKADRHDLIELAHQSPLGGCFVEVGVYKGGTAWYLAKVAKRRNVPLYLYDTFQGIPVSDERDQHLVGDFNDTDVEAVKFSVPYGTFCVGFFPDTFVPVDKVSFVHCDCDQYQTTKDVLNIFYPLLVPGGIIVVDDYFSLQSATDAVDELFVVTELTRGKKAVIRHGTSQKKETKKR